MVCFAIVTDAWYVDIYIYKPALALSWDVMRAVNIGNKGLDWFKEPGSI